MILYCFSDVDNNHYTDVSTISVSHPKAYCLFSCSITNIAHRLYTHTTTHGVLISKNYRSNTDVSFWILVTWI